MNFAFSEEQKLLRKSAADLVARSSSMQRVRGLSEDGLGYSPELWRQMAELGWLGIPFSEEQGGLGGGLVEMCCVMEALGGGLCPEPVLASVLLGGRALSLAGSSALQQEWLPELIEGRRHITLAYQESQGRFDPYNVLTRAEAVDGGWVLSGEKTQVPQVEGSDAVIVVARRSGGQRDAGGLGLFLVPTAVEGLRQQAVPCMDRRKRSTVTLEGVCVGATDELKERPADGVLNAVLSAATVGLCAEMLGAMSQAFETTVDYLKTRKQFGVFIGTFQALKHRAADAYVQLELAQSAVYYAAMALDERQSDALAAVSTAKARCNDAYRLIGNESIQMHGGIGMTEEHDIGLYFKHGRVAEVTLGDSPYHRDLFARLREY